MPNAKHYRVCNLCEAMCGLEIEHDGQRVISVRGDAKDPFSRGYICPKGANYGNLHADPNRLRKPLKRVGEEWQEISWEAAFQEVGERINGIRTKYGNDAVATYVGNPSVHNYGTILYLGQLRKALQSKHNYSATSVDQLPHHFAGHFMFGHYMRVPVPDINRTDYMILLGANPAVSNGSLMSVAGVEKKLRAIQERGGKYVVFDPRRSETAKSADEHHFIRPGRDVYLLLGMLNHLFAEGFVKLGRLKEHVAGFEGLADLFKDFTPAKVANVTGVPASEIRRITEAFAATEKAVIYGRMGVSTQEYGGLCHWLINLINICTGHFDREGGAMFTRPAVPVIRSKKMKTRFGRWSSRVRKLPEFEGELPVSTLAEDILEPGEGKIRALITNAGNPVISTPNSNRLERALDELDYMVCIDIYLNETTRHADIILPPAFGLEVEHYDIVFNSFAVRNTAKFTTALFQPVTGAKYDWQIFKALIAQFSRRKLTRFEKWSTPRRLLNLALLNGPYGKWSNWQRLFSGLSLKKLLKSPHGIDLGPLQSVFPKGLLTPDRKVHLADQVFVISLEDLRKEFLADKPVEAKNAFQLIGRRSLKSNNSWMHNVPKLMAGRDRCTALLHPHDAAILKFKDKQKIRVTSRVGSLEIPLEISDEIMPGVISIPHGYGHDGNGTRLEVATKKPGANHNVLTDHTHIDKLTGNAALSGVLVSIEAV